MDNRIFPWLDPQAAEPNAAAALPVAREVKWDYEKDRPVMRGGEPVFVERAEAVAVWAWNALHTVRWMWELYTGLYGNEIGRLVGQPYTLQVKQAEIPRLLRECLMVSPYVRELRDIRSSFEGSRLTITFALVSIYGQSNLEVSYNV